MHHPSIVPTHIPSTKTSVKAMVVDVVHACLVCAMEQPTFIITGGKNTVSIKITHHPNYGSNKTLVHNFSWWLFFSLINSTDMGQQLVLPLFQEQYQVNWLWSYKLYQLNRSRMNNKICGNNISLAAQILLSQYTHCRGMVYDD